MPTLHRLPGMSIRVNVPDHRPAHVHVVLADRRDALVDLESLQVISRTVRAKEIALAMVWIKSHREIAQAVFEECNP